MNNDRTCECPILFLCIDVANKSDRDVVKEFQRSSSLKNMLMLEN